MTNSINKLFLVSILTIGISQFSLFAQQTNFDKIVVPITQKAASYEEKLVQLAWQNNP